ncbi:MAG: VanZ family protein [Aliidiomarina sp.]|uniref:VanZ family protein n=1 Tax=Aliidiomarina sp. TaxID=1872439 RepID=UPI0025BA412F|nr:VanZ family protein [Aliidiomarina sp.]MCH8501923.1 VanZ family protein [Aliidiomarina sp.]
MRFWRITFVLVLVSISILFLIQSPPTPAQVARFAHADKVAHFALFFILAGSLHLAFRPRVLLGLTLLLIYGVLIEVVQHYVPGRGADVWDVVADMAGAASFYLLRLVVLWPRRRRILRT